MIKPSVKVGDCFKTNEGQLATVVEYRNCDEVYVSFDDSHDYTHRVKACHIKNGKVSNPYYPALYGIGYVGAGEFKATKNGKPTKEYMIWSAIFQRCYTTNRKINHRFYDNCTVSPEWHNFQNFAEWYSKNEFSGLGYHVDKDILEKGNTVYGPEFCVLVPRIINNTFQKRQKMSEQNHPYYSEKEKKYKITIQNGDTVVKYSARTLDEAIEFYNNKKQELIRIMAEQWRGKVDYRVYAALKNWRVA